MALSSNPALSSSLYREPFRVRAYEVGPSGLASVVTLCDYLQEAAGNHATALGFDRVAIHPDGPPTGVWVLRRLRVETARLPAWRETVTVETWPSRNDGLRAHREFVVTDELDVRIAVGTSVWFVIDPDRRRPVRLAGHLDGLQLPDRPRPFDEHADEPPEAVEQPIRTVDLVVRRADLDQNGHANHARFVEWAMESVPPAFADSQECHAFDLLVEHEAKAGDALNVSVAEHSEGWAHQVRRGTTSLARLTTRWSPQ